MMDQSSRLIFIRQTKSKALPIINPFSGERQQVPVVRKAGNVFPSSPHPTSSASNAKLPPSTLLNTDTPPGVNMEEDLISENIEQAFNVYARHFVPNSITNINTLHGEKIDTPAMNQIDFRAYADFYIGWNFLSSIPKPVEPPTNALCNVADSILHTHYERYFRYHLEEEIQSQRQENDSYALYEHNIMASYDHGPQDTCSLLVPGLRENSPFIEEDDVIELRQLRCDDEGKLLEPGWTGIIYNTRASGIQRKLEKLVVRVFGLPSQNGNFDMQHLLSGNNPPKFNVQFPVPIERYLPMKQVLPVIQNALMPIDSNEIQHQDTYDVVNTIHAVSSPISYRSPQSENISEPRNHWLQSMLFPTEANSKVQTELNAGTFSRSFFDEQLNWEQRKAVESICSHNYGTLPFLISGPPGTGKTKTLIETALQLITNVDTVSHILLCAPSDPAADTLVQRLKAHFKPSKPSDPAADTIVQHLKARLKPSELLRLNRPSRTFAEVPEEVLPFCHVSQNVFNLPPFKQLMACKIVVTTCRDASLLMYSRMANSDLYAAEYGLRSSIHPYDAQPPQVQLHWTALLMDEGAQAIEPEALIPLSIVAPPSEAVKLAFKPLFVMAADEHQLGPRTSLRSSPLRTSLFARLIARPIYAGHPLARGKAGKVPPTLVRTMLPIPRPAFANLIRNYRSHPAILAVPSSLFYADTLEPEATNTDRLSKWSEWRGKQWPVLFHNNGSEDEIERDDGGWYNIGEAQIACRYAAQLVQTGLVKQSEVCIMSPFRAQVQRLRKTIREPQYGSLWDIDIGPTEAFQGLEREMVILCTTRSKERFINKDKERGWGIIDMPNKMNVALTRAKFGLVVIGKREILLRDPNWNAFLEFCDRNGLVAGKTDRGQQRNGDHVELTRLEKVLLAKERDLNRPEDSRVLRGNNQDDEMWTTGMRATLNEESMNGYGHQD